MKNIKSYLQEHQERFLNELIELLKIPSISADSAYKNDVLKTAEAVKVSLEKAGCDHVEICKTEGYPIVYGEKIIDPKLPTVLVYALATENASEPTTAPNSLYANCLRLDQTRNKAHANRPANIPLTHSHQKAER